jgi:hypothetical protein
MRRVGADVGQPAHDVGDGRHRHRAAEVAAEGRDHIGLLQRDAQRDVAVDPAELALAVLGDAAVVVALREGLGDVEHDLAVEVDLFAGARALEAVVVEPERGVTRALPLLQLREQLGRIGHLRHRARAHERGALHLLQAGSGQRVDERQAVGQRVGGLLHLEALARALFVELDLLRE